MDYSDSSSTTSSITSHYAPVPDVPATSSISLFSSGNLVTLVHVLTELTVFIGMGMWVRSRTNSLQSQVNELRDVVSQQTTVLNDHTEALQSLMAARTMPSFPAEYFSGKAAPVTKPVEPQPVTVASGDMMTFEPSEPAAAHEPTTVEELPDSEDHADLEGLHDLPDLVTDSVQEPAGVPQEPAADVTMLGDALDSVTDLYADLDAELSSDLAALD